MITTEHIAEGDKITIIGDLGSIWTVIVSEPHVALVRRGRITRTVVTGQIHSKG